MIPRFKPQIGVVEILACLSFGNRDKAVQTYESAFAKAVGQKHAVAFPYGRTGLLLLLQALELQGREIILPAYTCVVVAHAIHYAEATPVFIDSGEDCNMDLELAADAINENTGALIATSIFGHPVDLDRLDELQRQHPDLIIIQDCAHSYTCSWNGHSVASAGRAAIYGSNISKIMTSIYGGMVSTDDDELAGRLRQMRSQVLENSGLRKDFTRRVYLIAAGFAFTPVGYRLVEVLRRLGLMSGFEDYFSEDKIDMPADYLSAMTTAEARVGTLQAGKLADFIAARRQWAAFYRQEFSGQPLLQFFDVEKGASYSHIPVFTQQRDELVAAAKRHGLEIGTIIDYNIGEMAAYTDCGRGPFPNAAKFARSMVNLPVYNRFSNRKAKHIAKLLHKVLNEVNITQ